MKLDVKISQIIKIYDKTRLTIIEYLFLALLKDLNNQSFNENFIHRDLFETHQINSVLESLQNKGFVRIIDDIIHVDAKALKLFDGKYEDSAKELLDYFNEMKAEHFGITRLTKTPKYITRFKSLLAEGHELEYIKEVLEYCASTWKNDSFWKDHFNVDTFCRHFDKFADKYDMSNNSESINTML